MKEVIAVLTQKNSLSKGLEENTTINLFEVENEKVKGVESVSLENTEPYYVSLFMTVKRVSKIYADTIGHELENLLTKIGIEIMLKDEMENDQFIRQFVFD